MSVIRMSREELLAKIRAYGCTYVIASHHEAPEDFVLIVVDPALDTTTAYGPRKSVDSMLRDAVVDLMAEYGDR